MKMIPIAIALICCSGFVAAEPSRFAVSGLWVGMAKDAAKSAGLVNCRVGDEAGMYREDVFCGYQPKGDFAGFHTNGVIAQFKGPKHQTLTGLSFKVRASVQALAESSSRAWGKPLRSGKNIVWIDGPAEMSVYTRQYGDETNVRITFDLERDRQRAKAQEKERSEKAKEAKALSKF